MMIALLLFAFHLRAGDHDSVTVEDMRKQFCKYAGKVEVPELEYDTWGFNILYPSPLVVSDSDTHRYRCFWSVKRTPGEGWYSSQEKRYLRLDSIAGMSYDSWPDDIKKRYRYDDKEEGEVYAKAVTGTFYFFEPLYYMEWWCSPSYGKMIVEKGKMRIDPHVSISKAQEIAFDKGYSGFMGLAGIRNYEPEFSVVLTDYVNQVEKESRIEQKNPRIYDFLMTETVGGYDLEVLACSSEAGSEWKELRQKIRELPKGFFTPLYTLGGVKLPGFYLEGRYERSDDGRDWKFSTRKYFANNGEHILVGK